MQRSKFQCLSKRNKAQRDACLKSLEVKEVDIYVLDEKVLVELWIAEQKKKGLTNKQIDDKAHLMGLAAIVSTRGSLMHDLKTFYLLAEDLHKGGSILGRYEITKNGAKSYIKFKGNHKLRRLVKGTRYLSNNAQILALGIGKAGLRASAKGGALLTIIYSVPFRTLELAFKKDYLITDWIVNISSDVIKASISAAFGYVVGALFVGTGIVLLPLAIGIGVAVYVGAKLDEYEGRYLVKEKIVSSLNNYFNTLSHNDIQKIQINISTQKAMQQFRGSPYGVPF